MRGRLFLGTALGLALLAAATAASAPPPPQEASADFDPDTGETQISWTYPEAEADAFVVWFSLEDLPEDARAPGIRIEKVRPDDLRRQDGRFVYVHDLPEKAESGSPTYYRVTAQVEGASSPATDALLAIPWTTPGQPRDVTTDDAYGLGRYGGETYVEVCASPPAETGGTTPLMHVQRKRDGAWTDVGTLLDGCWEGAVSPFQFGGTETFRVRAFNLAGTGPAAEAVHEYGVGGLLLSLFMVGSLGGLGPLAYRFFTSLSED